MSNVNTPIPGEVSFDRLFSHMESIVGEEGLSLKNITNVILSLMQFVQTMGGLKGSQKKQLVVEVVKNFIEQKVTDSDVSNGLQTFVQLTLPGLIDSFVALNNGEVLIKTKKCLAKLMTKCC